MDSDYIDLKEIKPVLGTYLKESQILLNRAPFPDEEVIHDIRVCMKKARAVLKLIAPQLHREYVTRDILELREIGRKMSLWRETSVLRKTLKQLKKESPGIFSRLTDNEKVTSILKKPASVLEMTDSIRTEVEMINSLLKKTGFRIRFLTTNRLDATLLMRELEQTYARVTDAYLICRNNPSPDKIHNFRKRAKDFLYQLNFFRPLNPSSIKSLEKKLGKLTKSLGRFNDLAQLVTAIGYVYSVDKNQPVTDELVIRIREKQDKSLAEIWPLAYKIFCPGKKLENFIGSKKPVI